MRRALITAAIAAVLGTGAIGLPAGPKNEPATHLQPVAVMKANRGPCDEDRYDVKPRMGHETVARKVAALIRCAERRWPVPGGVAKALDVAECESSLWPWSSNGSSRGVFQQNIGPEGAWWKDRVSSFLSPRWFWQLRDHDPVTWPSVYLARANVIVSIRMAHSGGWGPWACAS